MLLLKNERVESFRDDFDKIRFALKITRNKNEQHEALKSKSF